MNRLHPESQRSGATTCDPAGTNVAASRVMTEPHVIIIGGGLAGLSAGCYALRSGYSTTIVEHNLALGGVCTAWSRGPYRIDGCIHWLTGGPFTALYDELEITSHVPLRRLDTWLTYTHRGDGTTIPITRDLDALVADLSQLAPEDASELARVRAGASDLLALTPTLDIPEVVPWRERLRPLWDMRGALGSFLHFRRPIGEWARESPEEPGPAPVLHRDPAGHGAGVLPAAGARLPRTRLPVAPLRRERGVPRRPDAHLPGARRARAAARDGRRDPRARRPGRRGPPRRRDDDDGRRRDLDRERAGDGAPAARRSLRRGPHA
jgi:glycine/D-amino acid oxidase-like deaminating enzyme